MTLFDNALSEMEALLQCPLCNDILKQTHTIGECSHHFCRDCIYPVLGVKCRCPTCGLPAIVKNLLRNPSYDTLVACTLKIRGLRGDEGGRIQMHENEFQSSYNNVLEQSQSETTQGTLLWSFDCGPTFPDIGDVARTVSSSSDNSATAASTFPSVSAVMNRHIRERRRKETAYPSDVDTTATAEAKPVTEEDQHSTNQEPSTNHREEKPPEKIQMLRQMLGMPAWKSTENLTSADSTQQTRASTVGVDGEEQLSTAEMQQMPSPALGGFGTYLAVTKDGRNRSSTPTMDSRDVSPPLSEPNLVRIRKRRIEAPSEEHDLDGSGVSKRPTSATRNDMKSSAIPRRQQNFDQPSQEFHPPVIEPTPDELRAKRSVALSFLPLKTSAKVATNTSLQENESTSIPLLQTYQHKSKAPIAVASRRHIDIDQDITSRVVDMEDHEHAESEDEHPSLSHDDVWRCNQCMNINLNFIANEPNNTCDHCHQPKENVSPSSSATINIRSHSENRVPIDETVLPSCDENDILEDDNLQETDQSRPLDVVGSSQFSFDNQGLTMPSRHLYSVMSPLSELQVDNEEDTSSSNHTRQNAVVQSSSSLPHNYSSSSSQLPHHSQDAVSASEVSSRYSTRPKQQQQQQPRMVCCIFTGLRPEHRHAFDDNTTKLVEANLLMEQIADQDFSDRTTHIVTSVEEEPINGRLLCPRVLKYMYGMLSPPTVWIVRYEWFENSIHQRRWLPLPAMSEIYEVQGDTQYGPAPYVHERRRRRHQLGKKLFDGYKMFFYGDFTHKSSFRKQDLLRLTQYGGAIILNRKPPKATTNAGLVTNSGVSGTQTTINASSRSGSSTHSLRAEAAQYFAPGVSTSGGSDERPFLYVTEDIQPWQVPLDRSQPLIVCDPYSIPGKSVGGASTALAVAMDRLTSSERKKHGWLTTGGYQAVSATWLLNCISCSLIGKGDMQALFDGRPPSTSSSLTAQFEGEGGAGDAVLPSSEVMLQELDDAWRQWRSSSSLRRTAT